MRQAVAFIDVGFLRGAVKGVAAPQARNIEAWARQLAEETGCSLLRTYWYDGAFDPSHEQYRSQQGYLDAVRFTPGVYVRLGHIQERQNRYRSGVERALERTAVDVGCEPGALLAAFARHWEWKPVREQKGVDTLLALDLVRLAQRGAFSTAILVSGDRDLAEAVRTAQDEGISIVLATPGNRPRTATASELRQLADRHHLIDEAALQTLVRPAADR